MTSDDDGRRTSLIASAVAGDIGADHQIFWLEKQISDSKDHKAAEDFCLPCPSGLGGLGASQGRREHGLMDHPVHHE